MAAIMVLAFGSAAHAQASRTWVSGVGDDVNPCSRTAPCKTFAGAISKTAAGGVINVLDNGAYGVLTITKAITVQADENFAGVLSSGTNGFIVNAGAADAVIIKGVSIEGFGTGLNGIRFIAGLSLTVENVDINRVTLFGIDFQPSGNSLLFLRNVSIRNANFGTGGGILIRPGAAGSALATIDNVRVERSAFGIEVQDRGKATVMNSVMSRNTNSGFRALSLTGAGAEITVVDSVATFNLGSGLRAEGTNAMVRMDNVTITGNASGITNALGGVTASFGNNKNSGNTANGAPSALLTPLQ
ncbi:MAG TPA: right-handed parallel beta-helix repeat-containing protein [Thermoanaerobaculia bacterium]|nr:right-handed parallel beta-helix repeat-containing protein [Thermoanaerobaculia bacterium]